MPQSVIDAYLTTRNVNIIIVDWSDVSYESYVTAKNNVPAVGRLIGEFIVWMTEEVGVKIEKVGLVGHSLGAHIASNAGKILEGTLNHLIGR